MPSNQCPGQDQRSWKPGDIFEEACLFCREPIEFWKDDARLQCGRCGALMRNPRFDAGCAEWCSFAVECTGAQDRDVRTSSLCAVLIREMKAVFGPDERRIRHALRVLSFAEQILEMEKGAADPLVAVAAAVLHDIGIHEAERKHGSSGGKYQELEGPPIARRILCEAGVDVARLEHICGIIADHHSARRMTSPEFWILWDADHLVNLFVEAEQPLTGDVGERIRRSFRTASGRRLAGVWARA